MRKPFFVLVLIGTFLFLRSTASSQPHGRFGAGFVLGEPAGIAWKYQINQTNSIDGAIGVSPFDRYRVHIDYLWQAHPFSERKLGLHYGVGSAFGFGRTEYVVYNSRYGYFLHSQEPGFGVRGVAGLNYMIPNSPLDIFFEVAPLVVLTPGAGSGIDVGFGMRFYF